MSKKIFIEFHKPLKLTREEYSEQRISKTNPNKVEEYKPTIGELCEMALSYKKQDEELKRKEVTKRRKLKEKIFKIETLLDEASDEVEITDDVCLNSAELERLQSCVEPWANKMQSTVLLEAFHKIFDQFEDCDD